MRRELQQWPACGLTLLTACFVGLAGPARAQDADRALGSFVRPPVAPVRAEPLRPAQWAQALAGADRMGPQSARSAEGQWTAALREARWTDALLLLKTGPVSVNAAPAPNGQPAAHSLVVAARAGQDELVRALVQRGADINRISDDGFTALGAAAFAGQRSTVRGLVLAGADPAAVGASGQTALHLASLAGHVDVVGELLRLHVSVEMLNRQRETALDVAAAAGQQQVMDRLIEAGADAAAAGQR